MASLRSRDNLLNGVSRVIKEQPLILVALGIAAGAAIGVALPRTATENSLMGGSSHSVRDAAQGVYEDQYEQFKTAAAHAVEDIKHAVAEHGVSTENLSGLAHDVADVAKAAVYDAGRSLEPDEGVRQASCALPYVFL